MEYLAECAGAPLFIVSAGLGLVSANQPIPSYDLSISSGVQSAVQRLTTGTFSPKYWWASLKRSPYATSMSRVFGKDPNGLVIVAVSNAYVPLLADELSRLERRQRDRLRLFGAADAKWPAEMRPLCMPYDARLDALVRGSKVDFAQRAAEHFVSGITGKRLPSSIDEQRAWVEASLSAVLVKPVPKRQVVDDAKIRDLAKELANQGYSHTKALVILRRHHGIACEQGRFRRLFLEATT